MTITPTYRFTKPLISGVTTGEERWGWLEGMWEPWRIRVSLSRPKSCGRGAYALNPRKRTWVYIVKCGHLGFVGFLQRSFTIARS
jgi:hypothetical protein